MTTTLRRFTHALRSKQDLLSALADGSAVPSEPLGQAANLTAVHRTFERLANEARAEDERSPWDAELVEPLYSTLRMLPVRVAADMRFWHWLCVVEFPDLVWQRWHKSVPDRPEDVLTTALMGRFLGAPTLHGVSRNTLARLWWCAHALYSPKDGYRLVRAALAKQDLFQAVFERKFGLYPPAARACIRHLKGTPQRRFREATKRLDRYLTTIVLEALGEKDVEKLLNS